MLSISRLVLAVAVAVTFLLVGGTYFLLSGFGERMLQQSTAQHIQSLAKVTYTSMYQVMNQGWKREQVEAFANNVAHSVVGTPLNIDFHRSDIVSKQFGTARVDANDPQVAQAMKTGLRLESATHEGMRFLLPMKANKECLACHTNASNGDVLGVIEIHAGYGEVIGNSRMHLMLVLLLLTPLPLLAGFFVAVLLDSRVNHFVRQLDEAIDSAKTGEAPDFNTVDVRFAEFRELLAHFKRLIKG